MKWMICLIVPFIWTGLDIYNYAFSQKTRPGYTQAMLEQKRDTSSTDNGESDTIVADPYLQISRPVTTDYMLQTAGFLSTAGGGVELTYRQSDRSLFGNTHIGAVIDPDRKISGAGTILTGGLNVGVERALNSRGANVHGAPRTLGTESDGIRFYARFAPGVSFINVRRRDGESEFHAGINTMAIFGASTRVTDDSALFVEMGARAAWFPALSELRYLAAPQLAIGIQLFR